MLVAPGGPRIADHVVRHRHRLHIRPRPLRVAKGVLKDAVVVEQQHARLVVDLVSNHWGMAGMRETILRMILSA